VVSTASPASTAVQTGPRLILLVDDDADSRACMCSLLELEGYVVHTACDGAEALKRLRGGLQPGLIVLDLMMPGMDGFQFRREQLGDPKLSAIPVVIYSGHHDAKANAALLEPTAYVRKPFDFNSFLDLVSAHCMSSQPAV
jgi:CheY-like chemotaxis protein